MSPADQAIELFQAGFPVREIRAMVGLDAAAIATALTRSGQRPRTSASITYQVRVCPFFDSCRDCTFAGCALDRFKAVTV